MTLPPPLEFINKDPRCALPTCRQPAQARLRMLPWRGISNNDDYVQLCHVCAEQFYGGKLLVWEVLAWQRHLSILALAQR